MSILSDYRALLDLIESEPALRDAETIANFSDGFMFGAWNAQQLAAMIRAAHGTIDSPVIKQPREASSYATFKRRIGTAVLSIVDYTSDRCERVQVGVKQVEREVVITPAVTRIELVDEPVLEWICAPVLAVDPITQPEADAAVDAHYDEPF